MRLAYREQVRGLLDGGVDALLVETIFDTLTSKAALVAIAEEQEARGSSVPLMISVTITDRSGRTLSGQTLDAFYTSIEHARPFSVGINCALGAREMRPYMAELARIAGCYVSCYPNAGLPNALGEYDQQADETGALLAEFAASGFLNIVGGCCGTTPGAHRRRSPVRSTASRRGRTRRRAALTAASAVSPTTPASRRWCCAPTATSRWSASAPTSPARSASHG